MKLIWIVLFLLELEQGNLKKLYVSVLTLCTQNNSKLLGQLQSGFKKTIKWNKFQTKVWTEGQNQYLDFLIDLHFQGVNRLFVL